MKKLLPLIAVLAGCAAPTIDYTKLSAEQIKAINADRSITVKCTIVSGIAGWGGGKTVEGSQDKSVAAGETSVTSNNNCDFTITTAPKPAKPASAP